MNDDKERLARIRTLLGGAESVIREAQSLSEEVGSLSRWIPRLFNRLIDDIGDLAEEIDTIGGLMGQLEKAGEEVGVAMETSRENEPDVIAQRTHEEAEHAKEAFAAVAGEQYEPSTQELGALGLEDASPSQQEQPERSTEG